MREAARILNFEWMNLRIASCLSATIVTSVVASGPAVSLIRTPDGGVQPQTAVDSSNTIHLVYYKGDPQGGDIFYTSRGRDKATFAPPIQVNSQRGSAIAMGTIRGAQLAVGSKGRVHVIWNGGAGAAPVKHPGPPVLYSRLDDSRTRFESERDLITFAAGLDGGSSVAADGRGRVYVTWHARLPDSKDDEESRAVFVARSEDEGVTFERERPALAQRTGACACCGMRALADENGGVYMLFRAASAMTNRDELLVFSGDRSEHFEIAKAHRWVTATCPMSSAFLSLGNGRVWAAWETEGQVWHASLDPRTGQVSGPVAPTGQASRKHPVTVENRRGEVLVAWLEGTGWAKGGAVVWQLYDRQGRPVGERGTADGVPPWSLASAFANPDDTFTIVY